MLRACASAWSTGEWLVVQLSRSCWGVVACSCDRAAIPSINNTIYQQSYSHTWLNMQRTRLCPTRVLSTTGRINAWLRNESDPEVALSYPRPSKRRELMPMSLWSNHAHRAPPNGAASTAGEYVPAAVAPCIRTLQTRLRHRLERNSSRLV
jgi:hypothetical protein